MTVELSHYRNPDIGGGYWQEPIDSGKRRRVPVATLADASRVCLEFTRRNQLGGGNWNGGKIREGSKVIAHVSYNGRVWKGEKWAAGDKPI